ncbi:hypothetical protein BDZ89DRAFT_1051848 [Hymenopellis radicata]|nr:hypothetical protein BDZ89DRAFT_1051848 [Hymenopellis radicata]
MVQHTHALSSLSTITMTSEAELAEVLRNVAVNCEPADFLTFTMTESQEGFEQRVAQFMHRELEWIGVPPQYTLSCMTAGIAEYLNVLESAAVCLDALAPSGLVAFAQAHVEMALRTPAITLTLVTNLVFYISFLHDTTRFAGSHILLMEGDNGPNIVRTRRIIWKMALARAIFRDLVRRGAPYNLPHLPDAHVTFAFALRLQEAVRQRVLLYQEEERVSRKRMQSPLFPRRLLSYYRRLQTKQSSMPRPLPPAWVKNVIVLITIRVASPYLKEKLPRQSSEALAASRDAPIDVDITTSRQIAGISVYDFLGVAALRFRPGSCPPFPAHVPAAHTSAREESRPACLAASPELVESAVLVPLTSTEDIKKLAYRLNALSGTKEIRMEERCLTCRGQVQGESEVQSGAEDSSRRGGTVAPLDGGWNESEDDSLRGSAAHSNGKTPKACRGEEYDARDKELKIIRVWVDLLEKFRKSILIYHQYCSGSKISTLTRVDLLARPLDQITSTGPTP